MDWKQAMDELKKDDLSPIYIVRGDEATLIQRFVEQVRVSAEQALSDGIRIQRYWFDEGLDAAVQACQSMPLFGGGDIIVLERCLLFSSSSKSKVDMTELERYLESPNAERTLILIVPDGAWDERKKVTKAAKALPIVDCSTPKGEDLVSALSEIARGHGMDITGDAVREVARRCHQLTAAERELEKLALYAFPSEVQVRHVEELVAIPLEDNVFRWISFVVEGNVRQAFVSLQDMILAGNEPVALLALIARQIRLMWYGKWGAEAHQSQSEIAKRINAHPFAVKTATLQARNVSRNRLEDLLTEVADVEYQVKSGRMDARHALDYIVMRCLASTMPRVARRA